jgi:glycosyltransferase involved in cell wall biosynthesis
MLDRGFNFTLKLWIAGTFIDPLEKAEFDRIVSKHATADFLQYFGFVSGAQKIHLLRNADLFCFPTYYENENQPVNLIEAMAFGLPILTTRWRSIPEIFPVDYPGLVDVRSPEQIANVLPALVTGEAGHSFRQIFLRNFTLSQHLSFLAEAFHDVENSKHQPAPWGATQPMAAS